MKAIACDHCGQRRWHTYCGEGLGYSCGVCHRVNISDGSPDERGDDHLIPELVYGFVPEELSAILLAEAPWVNVQDAPRNECFMALDTTRTYTYGSQARGRTYVAASMHVAVRYVMERLNTRKPSAAYGPFAEREIGHGYNICVLNAYRDEHQHLGWHADDSPEQDERHPIAVVSFGAERAIWVKPRGAKGNVPEEDRYLLKRGSLFVMPPGFQSGHLHKIPKHDRPCGPRVSLTFRKLDR